MATGKSQRGHRRDPGALRASGREAHELDLLEARAQSEERNVNRRVKAVLLYLSGQGS